MHIITQTKLRVFGKQYRDADEPLRAWESLMRSKRYTTSHEVRADFGSADFLSGNRVVFDIGGNKYRLVVKMMYKWGRILIRGVWTHEEYTRLSKKGFL
jgi:mRNA interferase HigB